MQGRPAPEGLLTAIADYALAPATNSPLAFDTAVYCLMDALACAFQALKYPACMRLLGPVVPGATLTGGARVPGTSYELDPINAASNIGTMVRWLDVEGTWLDAQWGQPSDTVGAILAVADYLSRSGESITVRNLLTAMIKAHEIQGALGLQDCVTRTGLDQVLRVRVASTAVASVLLGATREQVIAAVSTAWIDGGALRGDATGRAVRLALVALKGDSSYRAAAPLVSLARPLGCSVMENIGHRGRLTESTPRLMKAFESSVVAHFKPRQAGAILQLFADRGALAALPVSHFVAKLVSAC